MFHSTAGSSNHVARSKKKPHSRSNSISSSSVATTVKRTSSLSSAGTTTTRPTTAPYGASVTGATVAAAATAPIAEGAPGGTGRSSASRRRSSVAHVAQDNSSVPARDGLGNLNRWSQSTASSLSSTGHRRLSSFSKRLSGSAHNGPALNNAHNTNGGGSSSNSNSNNNNNPHSAPASPRRVLQKRNRSPPSPRKRQPASPTPAVPSLPLNALPPIVTLPSLTQAVADAHTLSAAASRPPPFTAGPAQPVTDSYPAASKTLASPDDSKRRPPLQPRTRTAPENPVEDAQPYVSPRRIANSTGPILSSATGAIPDTSNNSDNYSRARTPTSGRRKPVRNSGDDDEAAASTPTRKRDRSTSDASRFDERGGGGGSSSIDQDTSSRGSGRRERRVDKDKKAMLAKALQKANTAVVLDNKQNFEGAIAAYGDACRLLQNVMERSSGEEDRKKLEAIRQTYLNRIDELRALEPEYQEPSGKSLPRRPMSEESISSQSRKTLSMSSVADEPAVIGTATVTRIINDPSADSSSQSRTPKLSQSPRIRESVISTAIRDVESTLPKSVPKSTFLDSSWGTSRSPIKTQVLEVKESMLDPGDRTLMPQPLTPRSPRAVQLLAAPAELPASPVELDMNLPRQSTEEQQRQADNQAESMSWLDTIDESDSSCASSVHSVDPRLGIKRKHLRNHSGQSQAEFDAAFDAAVEAAYDDGFEPYEDEVPKQVGTDFVLQARRNVELAKERVREAKREELIQAARERERKRLLEENNIPHVRESVAIPYGGLEDDDEERMLDEMTKEYMLDDGFDFGLQNKSSLPRESDSSAYTRSTWESSGRATAGTSLSTVAEDQESRRMSQQSKSKPPPMPPPPLETTPAPRSMATVTSGSGLPRPLSGSGSLSTRRFSGQVPKQLKIETKPAGNGPQSAKLQTSKLPEGPILTPRIDSLQAPKTAAAAFFTEKTEDSTLKIPRPELERTTTPNSQDVPLSPTLPLIYRTQSNEGTIPSRSDSPSSILRPALKKNQSSLSLSSRGRTTSISSPPSGTAPSSVDTTIPISLGTSPNLNANSSGTFTPQSTIFRRPFERIGAPTATTPGFTSAFSTGLATPSAASTFQSSTDGALSTSTGPATAGVVGGAMGTLLLTADLPHPEYSPNNQTPNNGNNPLSPSSMTSSTAPLPLEPCPTSALLRPFWLLRALYQTLAHPRGGYLSTKLFVPRDVWGVRGVKLRGLEDKVGACDLLTAACERVRIRWDEDAGGWAVERVAEELAALETVMDGVQATLGKKLGSEVGVQGVGGLFRDAEMADTGAGGSGDGDLGSGMVGGPGAAAGNRKMSSAGKNYLSGWRKLRSKNSGAGLVSGGAMVVSAGAGAAGAAVSADGKDGSSAGGAGVTMATLPMTTLPNPRFAKRNVAALDFAGFGQPMANYMASLARLCDAVQVLGKASCPSLRFFLDVANVFDPTDQIARQVEDPGLKHSSPAYVGLELSARHAAEFFGFYICRFALADVGLLLDKFIKRGSEWVLV
ncbi:MAG: hypothetical protein M1821_002441 [Bathelium mastoideum]|nr:MAG: hypothetical protein M1821_002441 [Bathelium mastoideum]KAI9686352.1 MAG: hypothetical protein M1822_003697 [Bathelium mastoideum]